MTVPTVSQYPVAGGTNTAANFKTMVSEHGGNFVASGMTSTNGGGLTLSIATGVVYIAGLRYNLGASSATMTDGKTNYVFFDAATDDYHVDQDNSAPTNSVRLATVVASGGAITTITDRRSSYYIVPSGTIMIWYSSTGSIPFGWQICDGTNSTPDLRNSFVIGGKQDDGGVVKTNVTGSLTATGGATTVTLTVDQIPAHTHSAYIHTRTDTGTSIVDLTSTAGWASYNTSSTGGGGSHTNMPPYHALCYIMKI